MAAQADLLLVGIGMRQLPGQRNQTVSSASGQAALDYSPDMQNS